MLLTGRHSPSTLRQLQELQKSYLKSIEVYKLIDELVHIEGDWSVHIDDKGTDFHYAEQKIGVDAHVKAIVKGNLVLLKNNIEIPFEINKRLHAALCIFYILLCATRG